MRMNLLATLLILLTPIAQAAVTKAPWGKTHDGHPVQLFTLTTPTMTVKVTDFGAHLVSIEVPDRSGRIADVVLGFPDVTSYEQPGNGSMGAILGRYANRIAKGTFTLDGKTYTIPINNGLNAIHGGTVGFNQKVWTVTEFHDALELTLVSPDGDMGFPGELTVHVRYTVQASALRIDFTATTTKPTVLNLTNHAYFNLAGESSGSMLDQQVMLHADRYTPVASDMIPTGQLASVEGTPFDFRRFTPIGTRISADNEQLKFAGNGYDHNYVVAGKGLRIAAEAHDPATGRTLTVQTTEPGIQFYSGNSLKGLYPGISGARYPKYAGFCLETQHFPDSPNQAAFPSTILRPGQTMRSTTIFTFGIQK